MKETKKKKILYILLHIHKCAGTTLRIAFRGAFDRGEFIEFYKHPDKMPEDRKNVDKYLLSLTDEQKDKIKVIIGHGAYYGIHKFFPNREARYITFLRNPIGRTVSNYNYFKEEVLAGVIKNSRKPILFKSGKIKSFHEWFNSSIIMHNYIAKFLMDKLCNKGVKKCKIYKKDVEKIKKILDKFYFIGLVENPEDFLFLYNKFGWRKYTPNQVVSRKFFVPKDEETKKFILNRCEYDQELYEYAKKLNKIFKSKYPDFNDAVERVMIKRFFSEQHYILLQRLYRLSAKLRKLSGIYSRTLDFVKQKTGIK